MRDYEFYYTKDGSVGLYSYKDDDVYHSKFGAVTESWEKFILPSTLDNIINKKKNINVLDLCYGIGYNTKALMSYVINQNEKYLKQDNLIIFFKKIKNYFNKFFQKNSACILDIESIDGNNLILKNEILSESIESIEEDVISKFNIDCLEINEELVKISPLLKTIITPQEIFTRICPRFLDCFESYWKIRKFLAKLSFKFCPKNKKRIIELLDLKFSNDYDVLENEYRIHEFVNYILIDALVNLYGTNYLSKNFKKFLKKRGIKNFIESNQLKYAKFKQDFRYKIISILDLSAFLHNIYYDHLSNRYKKAKFKLAKKLFNINFHINDARKSILNINKQYDLIFLDAFTFSKAPELWSVEFMAELYKRIAPRGIILTYSNSALVRNTFLENKFYVGKIFNPKTGKFIGTIASKDKTLIKHPLSNHEIGLCNTKAGIPYHDKTLNLSKYEILKQREIDFKNSTLLTSSQYMRLKLNTDNEDENNDL